MAEHERKLTRSSARPEAAGASHVESTQAAAIDQAARPPDQTRTDWRRAADRTLDLVRSAGSEAQRGQVAVHGIRLPLSALLVVRAFELWTHENDIRLAPAPNPGDPPPIAATYLYCQPRAARYTTPGRDPDHERRHHSEVQR